MPLGVPRRSGFRVPPTLADRQVVMADAFREAARRSVYNATPLFGEDVVPAASSGDGEGRLAGAGFEEEPAPGVGGDGNSPSLVVGFDTATPLDAGATGSGLLQQPASDGLKDQARPPPGYRPPLLSDMRDVVPPPLPPSVGETVLGFTKSVVSLSGVPIDVRGRLAAQLELRTGRERLGALHKTHDFCDNVPHDVAGVAAKTTGQSCRVIDGVKGIGFWGLTQN